MTFLLVCPTCGERSIYEFHFGGEFIKRPEPEASSDEWYDYVYTRKNVVGVETEWWYHRLGCKRWFIALRDTANNQVIKAFKFEAGRDI